MITEVIEYELSDFRSEYYKIMSSFSNEQDIIKNIIQRYLLSKSAALKSFKILSQTQVNTIEGQFVRFAVEPKYYTEQEMKDIELRGQVEYFISNLETV